MKHRPETDPDVLDAFPARELIFIQEVTPRQREEWLKKWSEAGGKFYQGRPVALVNDPVWARISSGHYTAADYEDISRKEAEALGLFAPPPAPAPANGAPRYFYGDAQQNEVGPFTLDDMRSMLRSGLIQPTTPVYRSGTSAWVPAKQMPDLRRNHAWRWVLIVLVLVGLGSFAAVTWGVMEFVRATDAAAAVNRAAHEARIAEAIAAKEVFIGMTPEEATQSWGKPDRVNRDMARGVVSEQWVYGDDYIYFVNGKLGSISTRREQ